MYQSWPSQKCLPKQLLYAWAIITFSIEHFGDKSCFGKRTKRSSLVLQEYLNCKVIILNYVHVIFYSIAITPKHPCPCNEYQLSLYCYCYIENITINTREALHCMTNLSWLMFTSSNLVQVTTCNLAIKLML